MVELNAVNFYGHNNSGRPPPTYKPPKLVKRPSIALPKSIDTSEIKQKSLHFFEETTAHGCNKIFNNKKSIWVKIFWAVVLLISISGLIWMVQVRISSYIKVAHSSSFTSSILQGKNNSLDFPSISVCSEGFLTELVLEDHYLMIRDGIKKFYQDPSEIFTWASDYETQEYFDFIAKYDILNKNDLFQYFKTYLEYNIHQALLKFDGQDPDMTSCEGLFENVDSCSSQQNFTLAVDFLTFLDFDAEIAEETSDFQGNLDQ